MRDTFAVFAALNPEERISLKFDMEKKIARVHLVKTATGKVKENADLSHHLLLFIAGFGVP